MPATKIRNKILPIATCLFNPTKKKHVVTFIYSFYLEVSKCLRNFHYPHNDPLLQQVAKGSSALFKPQENKMIKTKPFSQDHAENKLEKIK